MDKGFNDDELADIMNEIESLEKEFTEDVSTPVEDPIAEEMKEALEASTEEVAPEEAVVEEVVAEVIAEEPVSEEVVAEMSVVEEPIHEEPVVEEPIIEDFVSEAQFEDEVDEMVEETVTEDFVSDEVVAEVETVHAQHDNDIVPSASLTQPQHDVEVDSEMEEVLSELTEMPVEEVVSKHDAHDDNLHHMSHGDNKSHKAPATTGGHSSMSFNVEGDMKLDLAFNISGKVVQLKISEHGFELELDGGVKFSIPLDDDQSNKKAA
jgi:hypothetical protein